jgi:hypothetical protein
MRFRKLRIAVTVLSLTACVLLIALWVRSHKTSDMWRSNPIGGKCFNASSLLGQVKVAVFDVPPAGFRRLFPFGYKVSHVDKSMRVDESWVGGKYSSGNFAVWMPHWLLALLVAVLAYMPWIRSLRRFSLRTLLIATTIVAVLLGAVVWAVG